MRLAYLVSLAMTALIAGCANHTRPIVTTTPTTVQQRNAQHVWDASGQVLRDYGFTVDRQDRRDMLLTTEPLVGPQWFECWRKDAVTRYDRNESSAQTIYRMVIVKIRPTAPGEPIYRPIVEVYVARSDNPTQTISNISDVYRLFVISGASRKTTDMIFNSEPTPPEFRTDLGRDEDLERVLANKIVRASGMQGS